MAVTVVPNLERLSVKGIVTSPNYPGNYPNNINKTDTIQVEEGLILSLQFVAFNIEAEYDYDYYTYEYDYDTIIKCWDHLTIMDGNGRILFEKSCGSSLPAENITSTSNVVKLVFFTGAAITSSGWSVSWSAVKPGNLPSFFLFRFNLILIHPFN